MIDIEVERLVPIGKASRHIPGNPHISCLYRWINRSTDPLETVKVGGKRFTSLEAIARFAQRCTGGESATSPPTMSAVRARQIAAAEARLDKAWVK